eukprot:g6938.t1
MGAAHAAATAAAVPPSWLKSNSGADLLLLATGVRGGGGGTGAGCSSAARTRSLSDSTAVVSSSASSSSRSVGSVAREARQQQQHGKEEEDQKAKKEQHGNHRVTHNEQSRGPVARDLSVAGQSFDVQGTDEERTASAAVPAAPTPLPSCEAKRSFRSTIQSSFRRRKRANNASPRKVRGKAVAAAAALACGAVLEPAQVSALYDTALTFDPPVVGYPTEITFTFTPQYDISAGKFIRLHLPGFTRGERNGTAGEDFGFNNEDDSGNYGLAWPSDTFRGWWSEGTPEQEYEDSVFNLYTSQTLVSDVSYTAIIDRSISIKSNCGHPADDPLFYAWVDDITTNYKMFGKVDYLIQAIEEIPMSCYMAPTSLKFDPPLPKALMHITVGFQPARDLVAGDTVTVNLKGFTSGEADGVAGVDFAMGTLLLEGSDWLAEWEEGTYVDGEPGFEDSILRLQAAAAIPAGELHEVKIYRSNGIRAQCGMAENGTSSTISVVSLSDPPWDATGEFTYTQTIGPGCLELNYCSGRGECDYCLQRCDCAEGFGSPSELELSTDIARDCSQLMCPSGVSWAPVLSGYPRPDPDSSHTMVECSNMGTCIRSFGICLCQEGFEGRACERYACPNACSGNGVCRSMRDMGLMQAATPFVDATAGSEVVYGWDTPEGSSTWDSRSVYGCVCDSSWEVGLGAGQTQEAEYFGPDCSMLHCPSGDDPATEDDETDCQDVVAVGGRGSGATGNLCHVDCSNRGICDYKTGVCSCFDGYHGQACDKKQGDGYGFNTAGV